MNSVAAILMVVVGRGYVQVKPHGLVFLTYKGPAPTRIYKAM